MESLAQNRARVLERIAAAARASGRSPDDVRLVAVTKTVSADVTAALLELGTRDLGENRVTAFEAKHRDLEARGLAPTWHYLGHVQRNKARRVLRCADVVHSVDSERLLETLWRVAEEERRRPALFLQVKLTGDADKTGLAADEVGPLVERAATEGALPLLGLMTMASLVEDDASRQRAEARATFEALAALARTLPAPAFEGGRIELSMGMSGDFEEAIAAGATFVRVGSALFEGVPTEVVRGE